MNAHLLRLEARGVRRIRLIDGLELISRPDLAAARRELDDRIERLHGRMRKVRKLEGRRQGARGSANRRGGIALLASRERRLVGEMPILAHQVRRAAFLGLRVVPFNVKRIAPFLGGPETLGDDRDTAWDLYDLDDAGHRSRRCCIERFHRGTETAAAS